jgi:hypothetical protein
MVGASYLCQPYLCQNLNKVRYLVGAIWACFALLPEHVSAQDFLSQTRLADISVGSAFESTTRDVSRSGYELEQGKFLSFEPWYSSKWRDTSILLETQLTRSSWFIWGFSTGERGEKYKVQPSVTLGYEQVWEITETSFLSFGVRAKFGGRLKEKPCEAVYSLSGGPVPVNCRLAASILAPDATLSFLWDEAPPDQIRVNLGYSIFF